MKRLQSRKEDQVCHNCGGQFPIGQDACPICGYSVTKSNEPGYVQAFNLGAQRGLMITVAVLAADLIAVAVVNSLRNVVAVSGLVCAEGFILTLIGAGPLRAGLHADRLASWMLTLAGLILGIGGAVIFILVGTGHIPCLGC